MSDCLSSPDATSQNLISPANSPTAAPFLSVASSSLVVVQPPVTNVLPSGAKARHLMEAVLCSTEIGDLPGSKTQMLTTDDQPLTGATANLLPSPEMARQQTWSRLSVSSSFLTN